MQVVQVWQNHVGEIFFAKCVRGLAKILNVVDRLNNGKFNVKPANANIAGAWTFENSGGPMAIRKSVLEPYVKGLA